MSTQSSQRGVRASQTRRPCQISRCGKRAQSARGTSRMRSRSIFTGSSCRVKPSRCDSRRTCVSTTMPSALPRSAETTFAVLRATPGSRSSSSKSFGTSPSWSAIRIASVPRSDLAFCRKKPVWKMSRSSSSDGYRQVVLRPPVLHEEPLGDAVDVHVGRLGREHHRDEQLERVAKRSAICASACSTASRSITGRMRVPLRADPPSRLVDVAPRHAATLPDARAARPCRPDNRAGERAQAAMTPITILPV